MKKLIIGGIVIVALATVILGWDGVKSYASAGRQTAKDFISDNTSAEFEQARIKSLLAKEVESLKLYDAKIKGLDATITTEKNVIATAEADLVDHIEGLMKARDLLKEDKDLYIICGREFTKAKVNRDAQARMALIDKLRAKIELHKTLVADLEKTSETAKVNLEKKYASIQECKNQLEVLKARETNAQIKSSIAKISEDMSRFGVDITEGSQLQKALSNYERKIIAKESIGSLAPDTTIIDYNEPKAVDAASTIDQIDAMLK